jgi:hypothetical protein
VSGQLPLDAARGLDPLLAAFARSLVLDPSAVAVDRSDEEGVVYLDLRVAPGDRGRVIGRQGRTADALRAVLEAVGRRQGVEVDLEIVG